MEINQEKIEYLTSDKTIFDDFIYTPWEDAVKEIESRYDDQTLYNYLSKVLPKTTPDILMSGKNMALTRQFATPNHETYRFMQFADVMGLNPLILEYTKDKYVNASEIKYSLAELCFCKGKKGDEYILEKHAIIDRNASQGKPLNSIRTKWGGSFADFHKSFFEHYFPNMKGRTYDLSNMYESLGGRAKMYYKGYFSLFLRNTICFEIFLLSNEESAFTKNIVLPAFLEIMEETGRKPLIVNMGPQGEEEDIFWSSYPSHAISYVEKYMVQIEHT